MKYSSSLERAQITEIFSSLQGEGPRMGQRHIFIRFEACHLSCDYCDERGKRGKAMSLVQVLRAVDRLEKKEGPHAFVCLTGGEPLFCETFLVPLCRALRKRKFKILLETNGILLPALKKVLRFCDLIAMDLKLPSVGGGKDFLEEHVKFLKIAKAKETYIKIVVSRKIDRHEYAAHLKAVAAITPKVPVFLQPVSRRGKRYPDFGLMGLLNSLQFMGRKQIPDIRVGIQLHKILNIR